MTPDDLRYTAEHEWVRSGGDAAGSGGTVVTVGITDYAQQALGDIVYVSLPEVGEAITPGSSIGELESTKSVSDLYAPVPGTVVARNDALEQTPELVNSDPYGKGWLLQIEVEDAASVDGLLDAAAYEQHVAG